jgi:hypothetical protein
MKKNLTSTLLIMTLCLTTICLAQTRKLDNKTLPAFDLKPNDLELSRLAQPTQYFD